MSDKPGIWIHTDKSPQYCEAKHGETDREALQKVKTVCFS